MPLRARGERALGDVAESAALVEALEMRVDRQASGSVFFEGCDPKTGAHER